MKQKVTACQAFIRGYLQQCDHEYELDCVVRIQAQVRMNLAVKEYKIDRERIIKCQALVRGFLARQVSFLIKKINFKRILNMTSIV